MQSFFKALTVSSLALIANVSMTSSSLAQTTSGPGYPGAAPGRPRTSCSASTFRETYGVAFNGTSVRQEKLNALGTIQFLPNGEFASEHQARINGGPASGRVHNGQYTIFPDCRGVMVFSPVPTSGPFSMSFVVVNEGREIMFLFESNDWNVGGTGTRK